MRIRHQASRFNGFLFYVLSELFWTILHPILTYWSEIVLVWLFVFVWQFLQLNYVKFDNLSWADAFAYCFIISLLFSSYLMIAYGRIEFAVRKTKVVRRLENATRVARSIHVFLSLVRTKYLPLNELSIVDRASYPRDNDLTLQDIFQLLAHWQTQSSRRQLLALHHRLQKEKWKQPAKQLDPRQLDLFAEGVVRA